MSKRRVDEAELEESSISTKKPKILKDSPYLLCQIPSDVQNLILKLLRIRDHAALSETCKELLDLVWNSKSVTHAEMPLTIRHQKFMSFVSRCKSFQLLSLNVVFPWHFDNTATIAEDLFKHQTSLTHLSVSIESDNLPHVLPHLTRLQSLSLKLDGTEISNDLSAVIPASITSKLTRLEISRAAILNEEILGLDHFRRLRSFKIELDNDSLNDTLRANNIFEHLTNLHELHLTRLMVPEIIDLSRMSYVTSLLVHDVDFNSLPLFAKLPSLKSLEISSEPFFDELFSGYLQPFTQLTRLAIKEDGQIEDFQLSSNLEELELCTYVNFERCTRLTKAVLSSDIELLKHITLPSLQDLTLTDMNMNQENVWNYLTRPTQLTKLTLNVHSGIVWMISEVLSRLTNLEEIEIGRDSADEDLVLELLGSVQKNSKLRSLSVPVFPHFKMTIESAVERLTQLPQLRVLKVLQKSKLSSTMPDNLHCHIEFWANEPICCRN